MRFCLDLGGWGFAVQFCFVQDCSSDDDDDADEEDDDDIDVNDGDDDNDYDSDRMVMLIWGAFLY